MPCYFNMNGCFLYKNVSILSPRVAASISQLTMQFPVRGKLKYLCPSLNSLSQFFGNLRKALYKIENNFNLLKL